MEDEDLDFSDCPEITPEMAKKATIRPGLKSEISKKPITLYLDEDLVSWYKSNEESHQSEINTLLREYIEKNK